MNKRKSTKGQSTIYKTEWKWLETTVFLTTSSHTCLYIHTDNLFEEELPTLPEHMDSPPVFSGVPVNVHSENSNWYKCRFNVPQLKECFAFSVKDRYRLNYFICINSPPVFSGVRVTRSLALYVCFVDRWLSFCTFSFGHFLV
jgi:hypothetical protein